MTPWYDRKVGSASFWCSVCSLGGFVSHLPDFVRFGCGISIVSDTKMVVWCLAECWGLFI